MKNSSRPLVLLFALDQLIKGVLKAVIRVIQGVSNLLPIPGHDHGVDKIDRVLLGRFRMTVCDEEIVLEAGDMLVVPKQV